VEDLRTLARHGEWRTREWVAMQDNCPTDVLEGLGMDASGDVRAAVAVHPGTPPETLRGMLHAVNPGLVAGNPACPPDLVASLARHEVVWVRIQAAFNPKCPPALTLEVVGPVRPRDLFADQWDRLTSALPPDVQHLVCELAGPGRRGWEGSTVELFEAARLLANS